MPLRSISSIFLLMIPILLAIGGCDEDTASPIPDASIRGTVVDSQGHPVSGAAILVTYDIFPANDKAMVVVNFSLPTSAHVRLWITETCHGQTVRVLLDGDRSAGFHTLTWDGRDEEGLRQVSGLYVLQLQAGDETSTREIFLNFSTYAQYLTAEDVDRLAETDASGNFRFEQDCLVLGRDIEGTAEDGTEMTFTISNHVTLWAIHETFGAAASASPVTIDPENGAEAVIIFDGPAEVRDFADEHWSEQRLACAYHPGCLDPVELAGIGSDFFPVFDYQELPLWVSPDEDEEEFLENIGRERVFVFGWDDFLHPSVFLGPDYIFGDISALNDPRVSANRETYRALLKMSD